MSTRFDVFVGISSQKLTWLFLLKKVKNSPDRKMIKLITFDFLLPTLNDHFELTWERERQGDKFEPLSLNSDAVTSLQLQPNFPTSK